MAMLFAAARRGQILVVSIDWYFLGAARDRPDWLPLRTKKNLPEGAILRERVRL